ncbi:MAG: hypothetical protein FWF36_06010 [Propionibacteriaceae bacterium]|nr:hypothetical protein [Propionibacteriaceae bacterium]
MALLVACFATQGGSYMWSIWFFLPATVAVAVAHNLLVAFRWDVRFDGQIGVLDTALTIPALVLAYLTVTGVYRPAPNEWPLFYVSPLVVRIFGAGVGNAVIAATPYLIAAAIGVWVVVLGMATAELIVTRRFDRNHHKRDVQRVLADWSPRRVGAVVLALAVTVVGLAVPSTAAAVFQIRNTARPGDVWAVGNVPPSVHYNSDAARRFPYLHNVVKIAQSSFECAAAALTSDGTVWFWSWPEDGPWSSWTPPYRIDGLSDVIDIAVAEDGDILPDYVVAALKSDGTVWVWNPHGNVREWGGQDDAGPAPAQVPGLSHIIAISTALDEIMAVGSDGSAWAWGGLGGPGVSDYTGRVPIPMGISDVATAQMLFTFFTVLKTDGSVWVYKVPAGCVSSQPCYQADWQELDLPQVAVLADNGCAIDVNGDLWSLGGFNYIRVTKFLSSIKSTSGDYALATNGRVWLLQSGGDPTQVPGLRNIKAVAGQQYTFGAYAIQG